MIHRIHLSASTAHLLTSLRKKHGFYFRTLARTDKSQCIPCEIDDKELDYLFYNILHGRL